MIAKHGDGPALADIVSVLLPFHLFRMRIDA